MTIWRILFVILAVGSIAGPLMLMAQFQRQPWLQRWVHGRVWAAWGIAAVGVAGLFGALWWQWGFLNAMVCVLHWAVVWTALDGLWYAARWLGWRRLSRGLTDGAALLLTVGYLAYGWYLAHGLWRADYWLTTDKPVGALRIALVSDTHMGNLFGSARFARNLARLQADQPDMVVVTGDFVDERTPREEMVAACRALGALRAPLGVYYVFGNHDKGRFACGMAPFSERELKEALTRNGVVVLEDEVRQVGSRLCVIGRADASDARYTGRARASMETLMKGLDPALFTVVLDHQPRDYAAQAKAGADLVLSGHTHGGQMIPFRMLCDRLGLGENDRMYGFEQRGNTRFIVTSGMADWRLLFRTGCRSEYVLIHLEGKPLPAGE